MKDENIVFIDCFSGKIGDLKPKQRGSIRTVLSVLRSDPNVSTWDMDDGKRYPLWKTVEKLQKLGYVKSVDREYPWLRFEITELGKEFLSGEDK